MQGYARFAAFTIWVRKPEPEDREAFVGKLRSSKVRFENCVVGFHQVTKWFVLYSFFIFFFFSPRSWAGIFKSHLDNALNDLF